MPSDLNRPVIPDRLIPTRCDKCDAPVRDRRDSDDWNQFVCSADPLHSRWVQSPPAACAVLLDDNGYTYVVKRGIPPAIGEWCFPGGYKDFGETAKDTVIRKTLEEARVSIVDRRVEYIGEWFEPGPGITVTAFLVRITSADVYEFVSSKEATHRLMLSLRTMDPDLLAFRGNRLALEAARKIAFERLPLERPPLGKLPFEYT